MLNTDYRHITHTNYFKNIIRTKKYKFILQLLDVTMNTVV